MIGAWHTPTPNDLPLPTPNKSRASTTLRTLAAKVPPDGPRIDRFPDIPPGAPSWDGQVKLVPKHMDWDYSIVTNALTEACCEGRTVNIYCNTVVSNRDRNDGKQLGAASAVLYHEGKEHGHTERVFGESVTEADTLTHSLTPGLDALTLFLATKPAQHWALVVFLMPSVPALNRALDASPHEEQEASIRHLTKLGELLSAYPNTQVRLQWLPRKVPFVGFRRARQLAFEAIRTADTTDLHEPQSIKKLKETTKRAAITTWGKRYHDNPRSSMAFKTALQNPP